MKMADIFDKMKMGLNKGVATISTGSKTVVEKTKINSIINNLEADKKRLFETMGQKLFEFCEANPESDYPNTEMVAFYSEIKLRNEQIELQKRKFAELDAEMSRVLGTPNSVGQVVCNCGYSNIAGSKFCAKCGAKIGNI